MAMAKAEAKKMKAKKAKKAKKEIMKQIKPDPRVVKAEAAYRRMMEKGKVTPANIPQG